MNNKITINGTQNVSNMHIWKKLFHETEFIYIKKIYYCI